MCSKTSNEKLCCIDCPDWASLWESLHGALVYLLLDKLLEPIDLVRFGAVCKEWRAVSKDYNEARQRWCKSKLLPMLLIPCTSEEKLRLYSIAEREVYSNIELPLRCNSSRRCCGSNHDSGGWLTIVDLVERELPYFDITLTNPFRKEVAPIHLPRLQSKYFSQKERRQLPKVILSGDPTLNPDSFVVLVINSQFQYGHPVSSIKGLNSYWIHWDFVYNGTDAIVYKSQIYLVTADRWLALLDVDQAITNIFLPPQPLLPPAKVYLVESTRGDLLLVQRFMELKNKNVNGLHQKFWTNSFVIHKVMFIKRDKELDGDIKYLEFTEGTMSEGDRDRSRSFEQFEVESIGDEVLFVGDNHSFSVLASDYPGCQPNSIYYTDDSMEIEGYELAEEPPYDMGVFNLADKSITPLCYSLNHLERNVQPPFWTIPPFNGLC